MTRKASIGNISYERHRVGNKEEQINEDIICMNKSGYSSASFKVCKSQETISQF